MIVEANNKPLHTNTREKYFNSAVRVFDYIVQHKALDVNPMRQMPVKPRRLKGSALGRWLPMEAEIIVMWLERIQPRPVYAEAVRLLLLTGMRTGEILKITRAEARTNYIRACSKVMQYQTEEEVEREIPVSHIPGLRECLDRLLAMPASPHRANYLLPFSNLNKLRQWFRNAVAVSGIKAGRRKLSCCRKSTIWWLENEVEGWERQDILDVIGHTEEVDDRYYRAKPKGKDIAGRIARRYALQGNTHHTDTET